MKKDKDTKQWIEFKKFLDKKRREVLLSKAYQEAEKNFLTLPRVEDVGIWNHHFLFQDAYSMLMLLLETIPEENYVNFMNWKAGKMK